MGVPAPTLGWRQDSRTASSRISLLRRLLVFLRPHRLSLVAYLFVSCLVAATGIAPAFVIQAVLDKGLLPQDRARLVVIVLLGFAAAIARGLASVLSNWLASDIGSALTFRLRTAVFRKLMAMRLSELSMFTAGQHLSRLYNDVAGTQQLISVNIASAASDVLLIAAAGAALVIISWPTALIAVAFVIPATVIVRTSRRMLRKTTSDLYDRLGIMGQFMSERVTSAAMLIVKLFSTPSREARAFSEVAGEVRKTSRKWFFLSSGTLSVLTMVGGITIFGAIWLASELALDGRLSVGAIVAIGWLLQQLLPAISDLAAFPVNLTIGLVAFERVAVVLDLPEEDPTPHPVSFATAAPTKSTAYDLPRDRQNDRAIRALRMNEVCFKYGNGNGDRAQHERDWALQDMSLLASPGRMVALVGPSGAGKSTTLDLLARLHAPNAGSIDIDGRRIEELPVEHYRQLIAAVTQTPYLFKMSIRENIVYGRPDASTEDINAVCDLVGLSDLLDRLPLGLETDIGEFGAALSGGERQRIAVARAVVRNTPIVLLDEATANLDPESATAIDRIIAELARTRITVVAAHRLATVRQAAEIIFLREGRVDARGSHDDLVETHQAYRAFSTLELV